MEAGIGLIGGRIIFTRPLLPSSVSHSMHKRASFVKLNKNQSIFNGHERNYPLHLFTDITSPILIHFVNFLVDNNFEYFLILYNNTVMMNLNSCCFAFGIRFRVRFRNSYSRKLQHLSSFLHNSSSLKLVVLKQLAWALRVCPVPF